MRSTRRNSSLGWLAVSLVILTAMVCTDREILAQAYTFAAAPNVGSSQTPQSVPVTITRTGTLATIQVLTQGITGLDYAEAGSSFSPGTNYVVNNTGAVTVQFTPKYPGLRSGAVVLADSSGNILGMTLLFGTGIGPLSVMNTGELLTVAGNGLNRGSAASGPNAVDNSIYRPAGVAVDGLGNIYYTDSSDETIVKVTPSGEFATIVGIPGASGYTGDGGPAAAAELSQPTALLLDGAGNLYVCDSGNNVVREIFGATGATVGNIVTVAGNGTANFTGDGGAATAATLNNPQGLSLDLSGSLLIADTDNNVIRKLSATTGTITTIAGSTAGTAGYTGNGGQATAATLNGPAGVYASADGTLYIADSVNNVVRAVDPTGLISTVAGSGNIGYSGDGKPASESDVKLDFPVALAVDAAGNLYISDSENDVIRKVSNSTGTVKSGTGIITTVAGNPGLIAASGDGRDGTSDAAAFNKPAGIALKPDGTIVLADQFNFKIREVSGPVGALVYLPVKVGNPAPPGPQAIENDGNAPMMITAAIDPVSNSAVDPGTTNCVENTPIPVGSGCTVGAIFKPTVTGPYVYGSISIVTDSASSPMTIIVFGDSLSVFPTQTIVNAATQTAGLGSYVTFTAKISNTGGTSNQVPLAQANSPNPPATVTFYDTFQSTTTQIGSPQQVGGSTPGQGTAILAYNGLALGTHNITAVYSGDLEDATSTSTAPFTITIVQQTNVVLSANPGPTAPVFQNVVFTANVTAANPGGSTPTGSVSFLVDNVLFAAAVPLNGSGVATAQDALLSPGKHTITANYSGDSLDLPQIGAYTESVNFATATTTVTSNTSSALVTLPIIFTASVSGVNGSTPSGNVVFKDQFQGVTTTLGAAVPINPATGMAVQSYALAGVGNHSVTALYQGDTNYSSGAAVNTAQETIEQIPTMTTLSPVYATGVAGGTTTYTVTVTANIATTVIAPLSGTVTLTTTGGVVLGSGTLQSNAGTNPATATAIVTINNSAPGNVPITATYSGAADYSGSTTSGALVLRQTPTRTVLTSDISPQLSLAPVSLTATVANGSTTIFATGMVTFYDGTAVLGTGTLNAVGVATLVVPSLSVGTHNLTAQYPGDALNLSSISQPYPEVINLRQTKTDLSTTASSLTGGQQLTLFSVVHLLGGPVVPTGQVVFYTGSTVLATEALDGTGVASVTVLLTTPTAALTAVYSGDINYASSTSEVDNVTLGPAPYFNLAVNPSSITVAQNQHTTVALTLISMKEFTDTLQLGCAGLPQAATCTFAQNGRTVNSVTLPAGGGQNVLLTIDTGNPLEAGPQASLSRAPRPGALSGPTTVVLACLLPGCFLIGLLRGHRRLRYGGRLVMLCLAVACVALSGCASLNINGTPAGTYTFRVTAVGQTGISQSTSVTFTVTK